VGGSALHSYHWRAVVGNEPSGRLKCSEFLDKLSDLSSQEGLCFMEFVTV
jgi:hypothetical protein